MRQRAAQRGDLGTEKGRRVRLSKRLRQAGVRGAINADSGGQGRGPRQSGQAGSRAGAQPTELPGGSRPLSFAGDQRSWVLPQEEEGYHGGRGPGHRPQLKRETCVAGAHGDTHHCSGSRRASIRLQAECGRWGGQEGLAVSQAPSRLAPPGLPLRSRSRSLPTCWDSEAVLSRGNPPAHPPGGRGHQGTG